MDFTLTGKEDKLRIYTTRPDTLFGVTFMVIAPEHPIIKKYKDRIKNIKDIEIVSNKEYPIEATEFIKENGNILLASKNKDRETYSDVIIEIDKVDIDDVVVNIVG